MVLPQPEPIAIVGSGCRFPGSSSSPSSLWKLLEKPRDVSKEPPKERFELKGYYHPKGTHHGTTNVQRAYMLDEDVGTFDATFFNISPNEAESIGTVSLQSFCSHFIRLAKSSFRSSSIQPISNAEQILNSAC